MRFFRRSLSAWLLLALGLAHAGISSGRLALRDGRTLREFQIADDELSVRDSHGRWRLEFISPGTARPNRARLAADQGEVELVLYPVNGERNAGTRRSLARTVIVSTAPDSSPASLPEFVEGGHRREIPAYSKRIAIYEAADAFGAPELAAALRTLPGVQQADPELGQHQIVEYRPNDTYFNIQWHLESVEDRNGGTTGIDVGVVPAWDNYRGSGIVAAVIDDGIDIAHLDLAGNMRNDLNYDFLDNDPDPSPRASTNGHGTSVAGLIAAVGDNGRGVTGVAFEARLTSLRLIDGGLLTGSKIAAAFSHRNDVIHIKNNSWGPPKGYEELSDYGTIMQDAIETGIREGRGGRGTVYIFSSGNSGAEGDNLNYTSLKNRAEVIPVAAVAISGRKAAYSTPGAPLLVCAPGGDFGSRSGRGILTTDRTGASGFNTRTRDESGFDLDYTQFFNGTSAAAPMVSGVVALILQANPNLGWRDVQEILIRTATKNHRTDPDWATNSAGFAFNHSFGAGMVHAGRATSLAVTWQNLPELSRLVRHESNLNLAIPDNTTNGARHSQTFVSESFRVEQVQVTLDITHPARGQLAINLISPSGMISRLAEKHPDANPNYPAWTFTSRRHWGEDSGGVWTVEIRDLVAGGTGVVKSVQIELLGAAPKSLAFVGSQLVESPTLSNGNGGADPGETLAEVITLRNETDAELTGVNCTFSTTTPGVTLLNSAGLYDTIYSGRTGSVPLQYHLAKSVPCGTRIEFQQAVVAGTVALTNTFIRTVSTSLSSVRTTNVWEGRELIPLAIPDLTINQATNRINLPGNPTLDTVRVSVRIDHTAVSDLELALIHPDRTEIPLYLHQGGDVTNQNNLGTGSCADGTRTIFRDDAATPVSNGAAPFSGFYRPERPLSLLRGKPVNGAWVLRIGDTEELDFGTLLCWTITTITRENTNQCVIFNLPPKVVNLTNDTPHNTPVRGTFLGSDPDDDVWSYFVATMPAHGTVTTDGLGQFTYTPENGYSGIDSFTYGASDGSATSKPAMVSITVATPIQPPSLHLVLPSFGADGRLRLSLPGLTGGSSPLQLEVSTNLLQWLRVQTVSNLFPVEYVEPNPDLSPRFYRLR